jgi:hypothetical protein
MSTTSTLADVELGIEIPHMIGGKPYPTPADATLAPVYDPATGAVARHLPIGIRFYTRLKTATGAMADRATSGGVRNADAGVCHDAVFE